MSSAETTHPIEWRDDGAGGATAYRKGEIIGGIRYERLTSSWFATVVNAAGLVSSGFFPAEKYARSFVEKSVKEAGHGE